MLALWLALLVVAVVIYHRFRPHLQIYWLLLLSYAFYAWWAGHFLPVLLLLTLAGYAIARRIDHRRSPQQAAANGRRRWLWIGIGLNVAALALLRLGYRGEPFAEPFAVLGVSFYSLQIMAYLFDTYSGTLKTPHTLTEFALYVAYFPKMAAGPIERPQQFLRQVLEPRSVDDDRFARAATLIAVGLTRKLALADPLAARLKPEIFATPAAFDRMTLATTILGYAFVLYNDFAGYTSIARGVSALFGIELSQNFAQPFAAHSFTNLWNRWHITFSHWLRDYVYLPVSRYFLRRDLRRTNAANLLVPPMATMLVCGLWHGASFNLLLWGGLHGVYIVLERLAMLKWPPAPGAALPDWRRIGGVALVFSLSCWTLVVLLLPTTLALDVWAQMLTGPVGALPDVRLLLYMLPSLWLDWMQIRHGEDVVFMPWPRLARASLLAIAVPLWLAAYSTAAPRAFVYQGF